jgi:thymidylate synthase
MSLNAAAYLETYRDIMRFGTLRKPRGEWCRDLMNGHLVLQTSETPCTSFDARKFNLHYAKKELLWYIEADPYADWIEKYATAWKKLKQPEGMYYSNYGQYLFSRLLSEKNQKTQFEFVIETLIKDQDSRRAAMVLLQPWHLFHENTDVVCTYAIHFAIYDSELHMTVMMRSNDAIWGLSNDAFCFWNIYQMVYSLLHEHYPLLRRGQYAHMANSLHIYERHFEMANQMVRENMLGYHPIDVPFVTANETRALLQLEGPKHDGKFSDWLQSD